MAVDSSNTQYSDPPFGLTGDYCSTGAPGSSPALEVSPATEAAQSASSRLGSAAGASGSYVAQVQAQEPGVDRTSPQDSAAGLTPADGYASSGPYPGGTVMAGHHPNSTAGGK